VRVNGSRVRFVFLIGVAAAGVLLGAAFGAQPNASTQPAAESSAERRVSVSSVARLPGHTTDCWIAGDLVGDANPADIQRALCAS